MTLKEYDTAISLICKMRCAAEDLLRDADVMQEEIDNHAGIQCHNREPGFPCFTHDSLAGYYNTPREVVAALEKLCDR